MKTKNLSKTECRKRTRAMIKSCSESMRSNLERVLMSGCVDVSSYDDNFVLPRAILLALLRQEIFNETPTAFSKYKKQIEKEAENIYSNI